MRMGSTAQTLAGLGAGLAIGTLLSFGGTGHWLAVAPFFEALGTLWVNAILVTVIPLIVSSLVVGVATFPEPRIIGRTGTKAIIVFLVLLGASAGLAVVFVPPLVAWLPVDPAMSASLRDGFAGADATAPPTFAQWLVALVPSNAVKAAADGALLPLVVFTVLFALALGRLESAMKEPMLRLFTALRGVMLQLLAWVILVTPIGVFALGLALAAKLGPAAAGALGYYVLLAVLSCGILTLLLYVVARVGGAVPFRRFARAVGPAQALAFGSHSSLAALPTLLRSARDELRYPEEITSFCLPFSASLFKISAPVASLVAAFFVARLYGTPIAPGLLPSVVLVSLLMSFSVPGIGGGAVLTAMGPVLLAAGLPGQALGVLLAVDPIPNSMRTLANVTGYLASVSVVAGRPGPQPSPEELARSAHRSASLAKSV